MVVLYNHNNMLNCQRSMTAVDGVQSAGVASGAIASAAVGAINVAGTVVAAGLMDKAGRK